MEERDNYFNTNTLQFNLTRSQIVDQIKLNMDKIKLKRIENHNNNK